MNNVISWILGQIRNGTPYFTATLQAIARFFSVPRGAIYMYGAAAGSATAFATAWAGEPETPLGVMLDRAEPGPFDPTREMTNDELFNIFPSLWNPPYATRVTRVIRGEDGEVFGEYNIDVTNANSLNDAVDTVREEPSSREELNLNDEIDFISRWIIGELTEMGL